MFTSARSPDSRLTLQWLVLLALVLAQLTFIAHQIEHAHHADHDENCVVCQAFERGDDATLDVPRLAAPPVPGGIVGAFDISVAESRITRPYQPRAPPQPV